MTLAVDRAVKPQHKSFLNADSEDSDQTGWMPRMFGVFAGRTCHFVGFVTRRLICTFFLDAGLVK